MRPGSGARLLSAAGLALAAVSVLVSCATVDTPVARTRKAHPEKRFLETPLAGFPRGVLPEQERRLLAPHDELVEGGDLARARREASALVAEDPEFGPAQVLLAQFDYVDGSYARAIERVRPVVASHPSYLAAVLLLGRSAERVEDLVTAYSSYFEISDESSPAAERAEALRERALEIVGRRVDDALRSGRTEDASRDVLTLARWAPGEVVTLDSARRLAHAVGDREGELKAVRLLEPLMPQDRDLKIRRGDLELEAGDPGAGLRIFQQLVAEAPQDRDLAEKLAQAKFRWRLTLLPAKVVELVRQPQLSRADFAAMTYWLFPVVRYGRAESGRIANDILDHPHRQEMVRVINLGLARVDPTLHTFRPDDPQRRGSALASLLRLLDRQSPRIDCLGPAGSLGRATDEQVCAVAVRCGLLAEPGECLPAAVLSGPSAFDMSRSALDQLEID